MLKKAATLMLLGWCRTVGTAADVSAQHVDCAEVHAERLSEAGPDRVTRFRVSITNSCGKDITAFGLSAHTIDGDVEFGGGDMLPSLLFPRYSRIIRAGSTMDLGETRVPTAAGEPANDALFVSYAVFLDRTATGDNTSIAQVLEHRRDGIQRERDRLDFFTKVTDFSAAAKILDPGKAPVGDTQQPGVWLECRQRFERSDAAAWGQFIEDRKQHERKLIDLLNLHSTLETAVVTRPLVRLNVAIRPCESESGICTETRVVEMSASPSAAGWVRLDVTLSNEWGKAITAVALKPHGDGPAIPADFLDNIVKTPYFDILQPGGSLHFGELPEPQQASASFAEAIGVTAVIFFDRTAKGDAEAISSVTTGRRERLRRERANAALLTQLDDLNEARGILHSTNPAAPGESVPSAFYECLRQVDSATPAQWRRFVASLRERTAKLIELYELHSTLQ